MVLRLESFQRFLVNLYTETTLRYVEWLQWVGEVT